MRDYRIVALFLVACFLFSTVSAAAAVEEQTEKSVNPIIIEQITKTVLVGCIEHVFNGLPSEMFVGDSFELNLPNSCKLGIFYGFTYDQSYLRMYGDEQGTRFVFKALKPGTRTIMLQTKEDRYYTNNVHTFEHQIKILPKE